MTALLPIPFLIFTVTALIVVDERASAATGRNRRWVAVWKPLSTILVILVAALSLTLRGPRDGVYTALIIAGLLLSLVGDVLLIFPSSRAFMAGLVAFLCAHLVYIAAFIHVQTSRELGSNPAAEALAAMALAAIAAALYRYLRPKLGKMRLPVIAYMVVISVMVHRALALAFVYQGAPAMPFLIVAGAVLFYLSDAILAIDRFKLDGQMRHGHLWNLSAYYAGQLLLALSVASFTL
ncbi:MAG TPA: lysoplasmalogenase [Anaerolineae bacterium]|jgi:uncharacterized membrane protein YhhN